MRTPSVKGVGVLGRDMAALAESASEGLRPFASDGVRKSEDAIHDLREAIQGRPKSAADAKARDVLRALAGEAPLAGDQETAFIALREYFARGSS